MHKNKIGLSTHFVNIKKRGGLNKRPPLVLSSREYVTLRQEILQAKTFEAYF